MTASKKPYVYRRAEDLGIPVVDATGHVHVVVTDNDVVNAKKANSKHCALARASLRIPGVNAAYFFRSVAFLEFEDRMVRFALPPSVQKEIVSFDRAQIFDAGKYQLSPMSPSSAPDVQRRYRKRHERKAKAAQRAAKRPLATKEWFKAAMDDVVNRHIGDRTVSGIRSATAPVPLPSKSPKQRYVHRTQYIRDLREPE